MATSSAPGNIAVPLEIVSQGDENALGFTLTFDPAVLGNPTVALGADAAGGQLSTNPNQVAQGRLGIALALAAGQKFAAGTRQFAVVTFTTPANLTSGTTQLDFDDLPTPREVSDLSANALPASYQGGSLSIVSGVEADVAPRPQGNGSVTITDWVQIGRFAAGLDTAAAARRQPTVIRGRLLAQANEEQLMNFVVELDARGDENALGLSLRFDPAQWRFESAVAGRYARHATLHVNARQSANGYVGLAMALPAGESLPAGGREIVVVSFTPLSRRPALGRAVEFADYPVRRELVDARANVAPAAFAVERRK